MENHYSIKKTAEILGIKVRTVRQWIREGRLKASKLNGCSMWFIAESEIMRLQSVEKEK